jgi:hypothetical protein
MTEKRDNIGTQQIKKMMAMTGIFTLRLWERKFRSLGDSSGKRSEHFREVGRRGTRARGALQDPASF